MKEFLRRLLPFVRPYRSRLIGGLICGILFAISNAVLMLAARVVVNLVLGEQSETALAEKVQSLPLIIRAAAEKVETWLPDFTGQLSDLQIMAAIATLPAIMILRGIFAYLNVYLMLWSATRTIADLRTKLFAHLQSLPISFFNTAQTGELLSRVTSDTQALQLTITQSAPAVIRDPITVIALAAVLFSQHGRLTLISLIVFPVCVVPILIYGQKVRRSAGKVQTHLAELSGIMHETFTGTRVIRAYNLEETVTGQFRATTRKVVSNLMRVQRANEIPSQLMEVFGAIGVAMLFYYVMFLTDRSMAPGDFFSFIGCIFLMYPSLKNMSKLHTQFQQARAASERVFLLLETRSDLTDPPNPKPLKAQNAKIEFRNVTFNYDENTVLHDINLTVKPGQLVALVGASGSGKTTMTNLLLRFYDPQKGAVLIGGTDIREVGMQDLRNQIAIVTQETILFNDTIRQNIRYGNPNADDTAIEAAARHAFAHDFILEKPHGYEAQIGEKGVTLSGGQRQRIAIARAIVRDAPILVLDEATSALDSESERAVQAALDELMEGRTTLCIAHRLSTIQRADLIAVMDRGRIVETGKHDELLGKGGIYQRLYDLQFQD